LQSIDLSKTNIFSGGMTSTQNNDRYVSENVRNLIWIFI